VAKLFTLNPFASGRGTATSRTKGLRRLNVSTPLDGWSGLPRPCYAGRVEIAFYADDASMLADNGCSTWRDFARPDAMRWPVHERVIIDGRPAGPVDSVVKMTALVSRKDGTSHEAFLQHYRDVHAVLVRKTPDLVRYVQNDILADAAFDREYDAVAELWWDDAARRNRSWHSPEIQQEQMSDMRTFASPRSLFVVGDDRCVFEA
jgi:uncharacterized protein (TIGR02118 family)